MSTMTTSTSKVLIECSKCNAPHFSHQLTCKRCGQYLMAADAISVGSTHGLAVAGGILAVSTVVLMACILLHMF